MGAQESTARPLLCIDESENRALGRDAACSPGCQLMQGQAAPAGWSSTQLCARLRLAVDVHCRFRLGESTFSSCCFSSIRSSPRPCISVSLAQMARACCVQLSRWPGEAARVQWSAFAGSERSCAAPKGVRQVNSGEIWSGVATCCARSAFSCSLRSARHPWSSASAFARAPFLSLSPSPPTSVRDGTAPHRLRDALLLAVVDADA